jgi:hypothetical protein
MMMLSTVAGMLGGGATAATGAAAATTATAASTAGLFGTGLSLTSILQGVATVGGVVAAIASGNAESASLAAEARDAEAEKPLETLQSVERKRSLLQGAAEAAGDADVAHAASGVDLSFGSAREARRDIYRKVDLSLNSDSSTTGGRLDRLSERARNLFRMSRTARSAGWLSGLTRGASGVVSILQQA